MLSVRSGAAVGLVVQVALLAALALTIGLGSSGWGLPWLRAHLPPRHGRKVVTAPLSESFGRDVGWPWRHRAAEIREPIGSDTVGDLAYLGPAVDTPASSPMPTRSTPR